MSQVCDSRDIWVGVWVCVLTGKSGLSRCGSSLSCQDWDLPHDGSPQPPTEPRAWKTAERRERNGQDHDNSPQHCISPWLQSAPALSPVLGTWPSLCMDWDLIILLFN